MARTTRAGTTGPRSASATRASTLHPQLVVIDSVSPDVDSGRFAAKGVTGDPVRVEVVMFSHGHEEIAGSLLVRGPGRRHWTEVPLEHEGNDRWSATFRPDRIGSWTYTVEAWPDPFATWRSGYLRRVLARTATRLDTRDGAALVSEAAARERGRRAGAGPIGSRPRRGRSRPMRAGSSRGPRASPQRSEWCDSSREAADSGGRPTTRCVLGVVRALPPFHLGRSVTARHTP